MKIEAGKFYKTRNGDKACVVGIIPDELGLSYPVMGYGIRKNGGGYSATWTLEGMHSVTQGPDEFDLVEEWKEPASIERVLLLVWDSVVSNAGLIIGPPGACDTVSQDYKILGRWHIRLTEGKPTIEVLGD